MSLDQPTLTARAFFGEAHQEWADAMNALHRFAQRSGCPLGVDVVAWFGKRTAACHEAVRADHGASSSRPLSLGGEQRSEREKNG